MRKDPPVDAQFVYDTMVLEAAQRGGVLVVNDPRSLRDCNEKLFALEFPQCIAPRSEEHTSELQSLMRISYAVFCLKKKKTTIDIHNVTQNCNTTHTITT